MSVLYVLGDVPARGTGGHTRAASTIRALARAADVKVIWPERSELEADATLADVERVTVRPVTGHGATERAWGAIRTLAARRPLAMAKAFKPALSRAVVEEIHRQRPNVVIADQLAAALACMDLARPDVRSIYNANNIEWRLRAGGGPAERLRWTGIRRFEREVLGAFGQSWMVSDADREGALELCPLADVRVIPNAVDLSAIRPIERPAAEPVITMVGSFDYAPNRRGLEWMVREVMPRVWSSRPEARLRAVGRWPGRPWDPMDTRIELEGFVPEISGAYAAARCCVAPLVVGGGTPLKVVEALAYGVPLVATPTAVRALAGFEDGRDLLVAAESGAFASAVLAVLDPAYDHSARAERARAAVEANYSVDAIAGKVARAISG